MHDCVTMVEIMIILQKGNELRYKSLFGMVYK